MRTLGVFAKFWAEGAVKTRLAAEIGPRAAARFQYAALAALLARLSGIADRRLLAYSPADAEPAFAELAAGRFEVLPQGAGDLGLRMEQFFAQALEASSKDSTESDPRVVLVGADSPTLPLDWIESAFQLLDDHPVVLGPADDGGYYLVAARGRVPPIFRGLPWSTPGLWKATIDRLRAAGLTYGELPVWYDVDDGAGLRRLLAELRSPEGAAGFTPQPEERVILETLRQSIVGLVPAGW